MTATKKKPTKKAKAAPKKAGRPSLYTPELAAEICGRIADGQTLRAICSSENMPAASTVRRWVLDDVNAPGFAALSARAYELGCDHLAEECLEIADTTMEGVETTTKADGGIEEKRGDMLQHRRLRIETRMRLLGKWAPKRYGDKQQVEHTGSLTLEQLVTGSFAKPDESGG